MSKSVSMCISSYPFQRHRRDDVRPMLRVVDGESVRLCSHSDLPIDVRPYDSPVGMDARLPSASRSCPVVVHAADPGAGAPPDQRPCLVHTVTLTHSGQASCPRSCAGATPWPLTPAMCLLVPPDRERVLPGGDEVVAPPWRLSPRAMPPIARLTARPRLPSWPSGSKPTADSVSPDARARRYAGGAVDTPGRVQTGVLVSALRDSDARPRPCRPRRTPARARACA